MQILENTKIAAMMTTARVTSYQGQSLTAPSYQAAGYAAAVAGDSNSSEVILPMMSMYEVASFGLFVPVGRTSQRLSGFVCVAVSRLRRM